MLRALACIALVLAITAASPLAAEAGGRKSARPLPPPLKDCTPLNGRWGYYGNPWCTKAEQAAWDRATSRR
jgi:hypothetical protein